MKSLPGIVCAGVLAAFLSASSLYAQTPSSKPLSTSANQATTQDLGTDISNFFSWIVGVLTGTYVPQKVTNAVDGLVPPDSANHMTTQTASTQSIGSDSASFTSQASGGVSGESLVAYTGNEYLNINKARVPSGELPQESDWFQSLLGNLGLVKTQSEEQADITTRTYFPLPVPTIGSSVASSFPSVLCAYLPPGDCKELLAEQEKLLPTPTPESASDDDEPTTAPIIPNPTSSEQCKDSGKCPEGKGPCTVDNLKAYFSGDVTKARIASKICQRESGSDPYILNDHCLADKYPDPKKRTRDYSVGLFQINMLAHCKGALEDNWYKKIPGKEEYMRSCKVLDQQKLDSCLTRLRTSEGNIAEMLRISGNGSNWNPWSTAAVCGVVDESGSMCPVADPTRSPDTGNSQTVQCTNAGPSIRVPDTGLKILNRRLFCIKPTMLVVHWSAGWSSAEATYNVLNKRDRSCQIATDQNNQLQMLEFHESKAEAGWCAGGKNANGRSYNEFALNDEITGAWFDEVFDNPNHARYNQLMAETEKSVKTACWMLKQYHIPKTQIFGHFEIMNGKSDPGKKYLQFYIKKVQETCK